MLPPLIVHLNQILDSINVLLVIIFKNIISSKQIRSHQILFCIFVPQLIGTLPKRIIVNGLRYPSPERLDFASKRYLQAFSYSPIIKNVSPMDV